MGGPLPEELPDGLARHRLKGTAGRGRRVSALSIRLDQARDPRLLPTSVWLPLAIGLLALIAIVVFDLGPALFFNDDWGMAWGYRQLVVHHQVRIFPVQSALALVQTFTTALLTFAHTDQRLLRLSVLPFVVLAGLSSYQIARRLGAGRFWSAVSGVALLGAPLYLTSATSYLTDTPYVGLMMAATAAGVGWVQSGKGAWRCVAWSALCPLQRQLGVMLPLAFTVALLARGRHRPLTRRDWLWLAALWLTVGLTTVLPVITGIAPPTQANRVSNIVHVSLARAVLPLVYLPAMLGLLLLPFTAAILFARRARSVTKPGWSQPLLSLALLILAAAGLGDCAFVALHGGVGFFPGNVFTPRGFTPILLGDKQSPFPLPLFTLIEALTLVAFSTLLLIRRDLWRPLAFDASQLVLLAVGASQLLPLVLLQTSLFDRYYLPIIAPLVPLVALRAASTTRSQLSAGWAMACLLFGVGLY